MFNYKKIIYPLVFFAAFGCKSFQELELTDEHQIALEEPAEVGIPANEYKDGNLFTFNGPINSWWTSGDISLTNPGGIFKIEAKNVGQKYECWGRELPDLLDFSKAPVLKVTARSEGGMMPTLGISLKDMEGTDTNLDRPSQRIRKSDDLVEYYFNFDGKWKQIWPKRAEVNPTAISDILMFVNPGTMNWTGTLYIDNIEVLTLEETPSDEELKRRRRKARAEKKAREAKEEAVEEEKVEDVKEEKAEEVKEEQPENVDSGEAKNAQEEETVKEEEEVADLAPIESAEPIKVSGDATVITDFKGDIKDWWRSDDDKIKLQKSGDSKMEAKLNGVGPAFETFGKVFSKVDFTKTPILKVRFKAEGDKIGDLRVDVKDIEGFSTNAKPNVKVFQSGTEFVDFYYDFTGKFQQQYPNVQRVNPSNIIEVMFFVNPGGKAFNGSLYFDEISAISLEDFEKVKK